MKTIDADLVHRTLDMTAPRTTRLIGYQAALMTALVGLLAILVLGRRLGLDPALGAATATCLLAVLFFLGILAGRRRRRVHEAIMQAWEKLQVDEEEAAFALLEPVLNQPIHSSSDRGQALLTLAELAEYQHQHDSAAALYYGILEQGVGEIPQRQQAILGLASSKLFTHELTDAVTLLGRLEQAPMEPGFRAAYDLIRLHQQVLMGHYQDAVQDVDQRRALFRRHLSTQAGYAYGLFASALHQLGRKVEAAKLWLDATTLIPGQQLISRYDFLGPMSREYPAARFLA